MHPKRIHNSVQGPGCMTLHARLPAESRKSLAHFLLISRPPQRVHSKPNTRGGPFIWGVEVCDSTNLALPGQESSPPKTNASVP